MQALRDHKGSSLKNVTTYVRWTPSVTTGLDAEERTQMLLVDYKGIRKMYPGYRSKGQWPLSTAIRPGLGSKGPRGIYWYLPKREGIMGSADGAV